MLAEIMQKNSVQKLMGILADRYGMGLHITSMISATDMEVEHVHGELKEGSLRVPICARGKYLATAIMSGADVLSDGDISAVSEMVKLVLEPALFSLYLERFELNSRAQNIVHEEDNVFPLYRSEQNSESKAKENSSATMISGWDRQRPEFSSSLIMLESFNPHTISRVAVHIHETGNRWAMLRYSEIKSSISSLQDIKEMGPMTLLIEDILQLSPSEQEMIASYDGQTENEPLILIGCTTPLVELVKNAMISEKIVQVCKPSRLELDRMPTEFSKLREAIELILDREALMN